ncbi:thermonuclease family protein [Ramlibacter sp. 2FC]|uniref:thermonuclease family protein n=1 Tax=Ramlibacter sp. 2FC TaxID=2502188 RepID=UPI0010F4491D|nr:thermonuclease family protein [Ramlibacter sp. 2FC]
MIRTIRARAAAVGAALAALALSAGAAPETFTGTVTWVSDGDTLWVAPEAGGPPRKLRVDGIDAPEICQAGGEASRAALAVRALRRPVQVEVRRQDDYGRGLARIRVGGADLGAEMVRAGQAWSHRWRHNPGPYAEQEAAARRARRGLFADPQAELPRAFRKRHGSCHEERG